MMDRSYKVPTWETSDFSVACYLHSRGVELLDFQKIRGTRNNHVFYFADNFTEEDVPISCRQLSVQYVNSESYRFDASQRALKKLCNHNRQ